MPVSAVMRRTPDAMDDSLYFSEQHLAVRNSTGGVTYVDQRSLDRVRYLQVPAGGGFSFLAPVSNTHFSYSGVSSIYMRGGSGGNTFSIADVAPSSDGYRPLSVALETGPGNDAVNVASTTGYLSVSSESGSLAVQA